MSITNRQVSILMTAVLLTAILFRGLLVAVNRGANDNHIQVAEKFLEDRTGKHPFDGRTCRECFHPKLYHATIALLFSCFEVNATASRIILAQAVNALAGIITILVIWLLLNKLQTGGLTKILVFAAFALNPSLVFMDVQATNDSFAVFFAALATYSLLAYLRGRNLLILLACAIVLSLGLLTKGTVLPVFLWGIAVLGIDLIIYFRKRKVQAKLIIGNLIFILIPLAVICFTPSPYSNYSKYLKNALRYKSFGASHFKPVPLPGFFERRFDIYRPGVISIYDSYLTFRILDLVKNPYITNAPLPPQPFHRTSLWSQLYGRFHFSYFARWVWVRTDRITLILGSSIMVAAIVPTLVWLSGWLLLGFRAIKSLQLYAERGWHVF